jgi:hypothetical protein
LTGLRGFHRVGRVNPYFKKKLKRHRFSKKKNKSQRVANEFCRVTGSTRRVTLGHDFLYFFINPARFQLRVGRILSRPAGDFKTMKMTKREKYRAGGRECLEGKLAGEGEV